jgi:hypothetical protein
MGSHHSGLPGSMTPSVVVALVVPLVAWRVYKRVRRNIGRQRSRLWRHWAGTVLCPLLLALMALGALHSVEAEAALLGGIAGGFGLGTFGLRLTRFERDGAGFFYTPNPYLGVGLSLLLVGRIAWRMVELYQLQGHFANTGSLDFARSPLTLVMVGLVFGYYATYSFGLLRWRRQSREAAPV